MDDDTLTIPLPPGTRPDPDTVTTQEIPVVTQELPLNRVPFPEVRPTVPVKVAVPWKYVNDPIMTMPAPQWDTTPVFDRIYGPPVRREPVVRRPRRKIPTGDKVLIGMAVAVVLSGVTICGMVSQGWGVEPLPERERMSAPLVPSQSPEETQEPVSPPRRSQGPVAPPKPPEKVLPVHTPERTVEPVPTRSIVVVPAPTPEDTPEPEETPDPAPTRTTEAPEAPPTSVPASPSPSPTPSTETVTPIPLE